MSVRRYFQLDLFYTHQGRSAVISPMVSVDAAVVIVIS